VFGGKKGEKPPTTGEAIQKLRETEEMLMKKQDFLEKKIEQEIAIARKNGTKNKRGIKKCYLCIDLITSTHNCKSDI
jgi:charged multivesicular body protein 4